MTEEDDERYRSNIICRFCDKKIIIDKIRYHCHLTGKNRSPAVSKCKINAKQKQSTFLPFVFHIFGSFDCNLFFEDLVDKKNDKLKFDIIPKKMKNGYH